MNPSRLPPPDSSAEPAITNALQILARAVALGSADRIARDLAARHRRRRQRRLAVCAAAACVIAGFFFSRVPAPLPATTVVVAPVTQTLPDGSVVELRAGANFRVEFDAAQRRVVLQGGEAHFAVRKDAARPFFVVAGEVQVRAVGTAFSVDFSQPAVAVLVTEGRVALFSPAAAQSTELGAGQRAVVTAAAPPRVETLTPAASSAHLAWRVRRLELAATPLAEAIPLFNRHAGTRLAIDPALGALRLSGTLRSDDLEALLILLRSEFAITPDLQPDGTTVLRRL